MGRHSETSEVLAKQGQALDPNELLASELARIDAQRPQAGLSQHQRTPPEVEHSGPKEQAAVANHL